MINHEDRQPRALWHQQRSGSPLSRRRARKMPSRQAPQSPTRPSTRRRAGTTPKPPPSPTAAGPRSRLPRAVSRDEADIAARLEALSLVKPDGDATAASKTTARPAPKLLPRPVPTQKGARDASTLAKGVRKLTVSTRPAPPPATVKKASPSRIIPKPPAAGPSTAAITPAEQVTTAMRNVNASLTALAELKAAGFKAPAKQGDANAGKVRTALEQGGAALTVLRRLVGQGKLAPEGGLLKGKELDVERAALAIAAKLLEMDLVRPLPLQRRSSSLWSRSTTRPCSCSPEVTAIFARSTLPPESQRRRRRGLRLSPTRFHRPSPPIRRSSVQYRSSSRQRSRPSPRTSNPRCPCDHQLGHSPARSKAKRR